MQACYRFYSPPYPPSPAGNARPLLQSLMPSKHGFARGIPIRGPRQCLMDRLLRLIQHISPISTRHPRSSSGLEKSPQIPETLISLHRARLCRAGSYYAPPPPALRAGRACAPGTQEYSTRRRGRRRAVESAAASLAASTHTTPPWRVNSISNKRKQPKKNTRQPTKTSAPFFLFTLHWANSSTEVGTFASILPPLHTALRHSGCITKISLSL